MFEEVRVLKSFIRISLWTLVIVFALTNPVSAQQSNKQSEEADRAASRIFATSYSCENNSEIEGTELAAERLKRPQR